MNKEIVDQIQAYWAIQKKSACPDDQARDLSIEAISKYLTSGADVLDIGCGNGYCTYQFAAKAIAKITGVDFSEEMIKAANETKRVYPEDIAKKISFEKGDATSLHFDDCSKDIVITIRCLINIPKLEDKEGALREIARILKTNGTYLMCENTLQGLARLNGLRRQFGLTDIKIRWHNTYLDENWLKQVISENFKIVKIEHFASLYYLISRLIYAKVASMEKVEPSYGHPINKIAKEMCSMLKPYGEFSPMRLYVLQKIK